MHGRRVGALVMVALVGAPASAAAQIAGVPVMNNPHVSSGPVFRGLVTLADDRGGGGYGLTGAFEYGLGRFAFGVLLGARNPGRDLTFPAELAQSIEGYAVYGATAAVRLLGSRTSLFAAALQLGAGFEDRHRVAGSETVVGVPSRKTFAGTVGAGLRVESGAVAFEPWAAVGPRLVVHDVPTYPPCLRCFFTYAELGQVVAQRERIVRVGLSGGVDVLFSRLVALRFAVDVTETTVPLVLVESPDRRILLDPESSSLEATPLLMAAGISIYFP